MNTIQKQKGGLIGLAVFMLVIGVLLLTFGIILTISGAGAITETSGIIKLVFGILMLILSIPCALAGIRFLWIGCALTATQGSIKMGNVAKEGGTVNMKKCDKCGTERKDGETECSNCGKVFED